MKSSPVLSFSQFGNESVRVTHIRSNVSIRSFIGQFNLDPNRVVDIILECFEALPERRGFFTNLLKQFKTNSEDICSILGFKFTFYQVNLLVPKFVSE